MLTRAWIFDYRDTMQETPAKANNAVKSLRRLLQWAVDRGKISVNPADRIKRLKAGPGWKRWPDANLAVATGKASGIVVIDIDPRNGGSVKVAEALLGDISQDTAVQETGSGGLHILVKRPDVEHFLNIAHVPMAKRHFSGPRECSCCFEQVALEDVLRPLP